MPKNRIAVYAAAFVAMGVSAPAQPGAVPVNIQGRFLNLSSVPPLKPLSNSEVFDVTSGRGARVAIDPEYGNLVFFTNDPNSRLFDMFRFPNGAGEAGPVHYPWNSFYFYSSINNEDNNGGFLAGSTFVPSGELTIKGGPAATSRVVYGGSWDNQLWWDRSIDGNPAETEAPLYSWADLSGGDHEGCTPLAPSSVPKGRFVVMTRRFGCDFLQRAQNVQAAGAVAWVIYDNEDEDNLAALASPGISIPVVFIRAKDGAAILDQVRKSNGSATVILHPTNIQAFVFGTYKIAPDGKLASVNLTLQITNQLDYEFVGSITTP